MLTGTITFSRVEIEENDLDEKLQALLTCHRPVRIKYFVPCADPDNDAFDEGKGRYEEISGTVWKIDPVTRTLFIGDTIISFEDIGDVDFVEDLNAVTGGEGNQITEGNTV